MAWVGTGVVVGGVATVAGVWGVGIVPLVAQVAIVGDGYVCAGEGINGVVVKSGGHPSGLGVAEGAVGRQLLRGVVGVGGLVVIGAVATVAGIGGIVVVSVVASGAIVGDGGVRPDQSIEVVVYWERGGFPTGRGGVALGAVRWEV